MRVRLTKKLAERIDDVDLTERVVGDVLYLPEREALCLIAEGWALPEDAPGGLTIQCEALSPEFRSVRGSIPDGEGPLREELLEVVERFATNALNHLHRLTALAGALEGSGSPAVASSAGMAVPQAVGDFGVTLGGVEPAACDLLATVRELCHSAREQRELAERLVARVVADLSGSGPRPGRSGVLVVDDSVDSRQLVVAALQTSGIETITASNGLEGLVAAHHARPAVVLMDIRMPVLDGIEAARLLKASAVTKDLNVIAFTANPGLDDSPPGELFVDVLAKPASPEAIVASVRRFMTWRAPRLVPGS